tara:strand:+ start:15698 stop:16495 length:798 start_codon:yes stop_codon:yes gene_type:complete
VFRLFLFSLLLIASANGHSNEIDSLIGLTDEADVEERLKSNMKMSFGGNEDKVRVIDRIGVSNLFIANIDGKPYISDSTGGFISPRSELKRFTHKGLFNALAGNSATTDNIGFYNYAMSQQQKLPVFKQGSFPESKGVIVAFMDPSCPNCANFHNKQRVNVSLAGYDVMYIPSARNPRDDKLVDALVHFYCRSEDLLYSIQTLYSDYRASKSKTKPLPSCTGVDESYVRSLVEVFSRHKFIGSPAFITPEGYVLYGYNELGMYIK